MSCGSRLTRKGASKHGETKKPLVAGSYHPLVTMRLWNPEMQRVVPRCDPRRYRSTKVLGTERAKGNILPGLTSARNLPTWCCWISLWILQSENLLQLLAPKVPMVDANRSQWKIPDPLPHLDIARRPIVHQYIASTG